MGFLPTTAHSEASEVAWRVSTLEGELMAV
jgi:hypothetical protein